MTTTVSVDSSKTPTLVIVVTDQAYGAGNVVVGADATPFTFTRNPIVFSGVTATLVSNDKGAPTTTAVFSI